MRRELLLLVVGDTSTFAAQILNAMAVSSPLLIPLAGVLGVVLQLTLAGLAVGSLQTPYRT